MGPARRLEGVIAVLTQPTTSMVHLALPALLPAVLTAQQTVLAKGARLGYSKQLPTSVSTARIGAASAKLIMSVLSAKLVSTSTSLLVSLSLPMMSVCSVEKAVLLAQRKVAALPVKP